MDERELVAGRIKEVRKTLNMNQEELSLKLGIKRNTLSQYEGAKASMSIDVFSRFIEVTGCSADWLLSGKQSNVLPTNPNKQKLYELIDTLTDDGLDEAVTVVKAYLIQHPHSKLPAS